MAFNWGGLLGGLLGLGGGLLGADRQNDEANRRMDLEQQGLDLQREISGPQIEAFKRLLGLAEGYNPEMEAQAGVDQAGKVAQQNIESALRRLNANSDATPGQSSAYRVRAQAVTDRAADPLRAYLAEAMGNPTEKRMAAFQRVLGSAPSGNMADAYFRASANHQPDYGPSTAMMGGGLDQLLALLGGGKKSGGAGGSGDNRYGPVTISSDFGAT